MSKRLISAAILILGIAVGTMFAIATQGSGYEIRTFAALATAQGAFIGIVFSIFILASQVSATEFSPLTLEQLGNSMTFTILLLFYILSILVDIFLVQVRIVGVYLPLIPDLWNLSVGLATGLASISFLSLIIARQLLVSLTSPDQLLDQTASKISPDDLSGNSDSDNPEDLRPGRSSLLTIERILSSAAERDDEYTVQYSSYSMYSAIRRLVDPDANTRRELILGKNEPDEDLDFEILIERWGTCITIAKSGPVDRVMQVFRIHRHLLESFLRGGKLEIVESQINNFTDLHRTCISKGNLKTFLLDEYINFASTAIDLGETSVLIHLNSQLCSLSSQIIEEEESPQNGLSSARRDVYTALNTTTLEILDNTVSSGDLESSGVRKLTRRTLQYIDESMSSLLSEFEGNDDWIRYRRNILNDMYLTLIKINSKLCSIDGVTHQRMLLAQASICCVLEKDGGDVWSKMEENSEEVDLLRD